jgi:tRNA pseudouridine38-40 synthase
MSKRILITIEYDGSAYCGWQRQLNGPSVQQRVEEALQRVCGERIGIIGASRTDAGVHALGQRAHFDTNTAIPPDKLPFALNTVLPRDIRVIKGQEVPGDFHARFDARGKEYSYLIYNRRHPSALLRDLSAHVSLKLDEAAMQRACRHLIGEHDFAAFQAAGGTAKTTIRRIDRADVSRAGEELRLTVYGTAFLYNMVRIIAGTLIYVGQGRLSEDVFRQAISSGDRLALGPTAPPQGLCLSRVDYEGEL